MSDVSFLLPDFPSVGVLWCWLPRAQLWRLEVASQEDSDSWSQERSDEGEVLEARPRQLGGVDAIRSQSGGSGKTRTAFRSRYEVC